MEQIFRLDDGGERWVPELQKVEKKNTVSVSPRRGSSMVTA